jgi:hypothetical protein
MSTGRKRVQKAAILKYYAREVINTVQSITYARNPRYDYNPAKGNDAGL